MRNFYKLIPMLIGLILMLGNPLFSSGQTLKSTLDVTELPFSENWDTDPDPVDWTYYTNSTEGSVTVQSSTYHSPDNAVDMANSTDETSDFFLVLPGTTLNQVGTRLKLFAKHQSTILNPQSFKVGVMTDPNDEGTYTNVYNSPSLTSDWQEFIIDLSAIPPQGGTYYIAIKGVFDGTNKHIYFDDVVWEETPTGPIFQSTPDAYDYGQIMINTDSDEVDFIMTNYGIGTLNVTDITLNGVDAADFTVTNISETLPFDLTANSANTITVTVQFSPTTEGLKNASLDVTANTEVNSIPLTGDCFDPTIYTLPWSENFEGVETPEFPMGWSNIFSAANTYAYFETATGGFSDPNCLKAYNSSDTEPVMLSITPPTSIDISTTRLQFMAKGPDGILTIGTMTDHTDEATFDSITSITMTSNWEEYILDLDTVTPITGTYFIAFKADFDFTYDYVYLDDITWMEIPTTPVALVNPDSYEFPLFPVGQTTNSGTVLNLRNMGVGSLTVTNVSGLAGTEFAFTDIDFDTVAIDALDTRSFGIQYTPITAGTHTATLSIETNGGTTELNLTANAYELPEGMIEIGWEQETGHNLPIENYFGYTYSQSLYTQAEINEVNSAITSIFYHKNDTVEWDNIGLIDIYLGHTTQDTISDWIPLSELTHVTFSETLPVSDAEGWVEFVLDEPFIYNNVDNLIVAVDENFDGYGSGTDEFYCHNTDNYMSARHYSDSENADPTSPPTITSVTLNPGLKKYRPNIRMQFEAVPATPTAVLDPEIWDAGQRPVGYTAVSDTYTLTNMGSDPLTVSAITDLSGTPFSTSFVAGDVVDLPLAIDYEFTFEFTPTTEGTYETEFIVETNGVNDTIMLYGTCDYSLPANIVEVGWGLDTINLPMEPVSVYTYSQSVYKQTEIDMMDQAIYHIYYRQTSATLMNEDIKVYMAHYADGTLDDDWEILGNLTQVYDGTLGSPNAEGWIKISFDFPLIYNNTDNLIVAFDENGAASFDATDGFYGNSTNENLSRALTNDITDVDPASVSGGDLLAQRPNIRFEFGPLPTDPYYNLNLDSWDAGMVAGNQAANSGDIFRITNLGAGTLTLTDAVFLDGSVFSTSLVAGDVSLEASEEYYFNFTFSPLAVGTFNDTLVITHADGTDTVFLTGTTDYVLPENMVEIGQGTEVNTSLPMEAFYGYSYSQSIFLQEEIYMDGMRISKLYYQRNGQDDLESAGEINIYMGHTTQTELTDWIPLAELQEVTYSEVLPLPDTDGWVEFVLTTPYIYNNSENLVIAFDENESGYDGSTDEFYNHDVSNDMSIRYYNDGTNPDPAAPPIGTLVASRPNVRLQFEELPTTPIFTVNPDSHDYGTTIIGTDKTKAFTVQNNGIDVLTINNIYLGGDDAAEFALNNLPTFPIGITNDYADAFSIDAVYTPTIEGDVTAKIYFEHSEGLDSVMLYATGYDATITSLPWNEYFDDPATTFYPEMTLGWDTILQTTNTYANISVWQSTYLTEPHSVRFYNSGDTDPTSEYILVTPRTQLDPTGTRLRFFADGYAGDQLIIGYMTDPNDATTFVEVETVDLETDYTQHLVDLSSIATAGYYHFAFKAVMPSTYHYIYLDNVTWETTPTTPVFGAMPTAIDFGDVEMLTSTDLEIVEVRNTGVGDLIITDVQLIGAEADQFSINVIDALNDTITSDYSDFLTVEATFNPAYAGIITADIEFTDIDANTYTVPLIGNSIDATMYPDTLVDFEDAVPPLFWTRYSSLLSETMTLTSTTSGWSQGDFSGESSLTSAARINIWTTTTNYWLVTSSIELGDGTNPVKLELDLSTTDYGTTAEADPAEDDRFAIVISTDNGATWTDANALRIYDNDGSEYVFDDIPNGAGEHVEISLADYSGLVKIGLYGESTVSNGDNYLYVDNFEVRYFTAEELALLDAEENTSMTASPELTVYEEINTDEQAIDYTVDYPTPFDANLDALLLHDFQVQFNTMIPNGTTVDVEFDGTNVGQYTADGTDSIFWVGDVMTGTNPALNTMEDMVVTLKFNGLNVVNQYDITLHSFTAYDGEFDMTTERTLLANAMAEINVTPTPTALPIVEDFDGGIPANWLTYNNGTDGADWTFTNDGALGSTSSANGYMRVNDGAVTGLTNADLLSYPIDMSAATGTILLEFEHRYDDISLTTATVYVSTDNGTIWTEVEQYTGDQGSMTDPELASIDISDYAGEGNVTIRWNYNDNGLDGLNWNIDDVHIYEFIPNTEAEILTFDIVDQISSTIDTDFATVQVVMPNGTDLSAMTPNFTLSDGAIASIGGTIQESGTSIVDFTNSITTPVVYTVIAEDNSTNKLWDVTVSTETSLANDGAFNFAVYPNPSNGQFDLNVYSENGFTYSIYAVDGKLIHKAQIDATGEVTESINLKDIAPGVYTLKVNADNTIKVEKLVIE
jgi:hypothetical protein